MPPPDRVLVIGAGIAGLTLASALARRGVIPVVIERRRTWGHAGSGIQLQGNALRALAEVGLAHRLVARGWASPSDQMVITDQFGNEVTRVTYPRLAGPGLPAATGIRRQTLHEELLAAFAQAGGEVILGCTVAAIDDSQDAAVVTLSGGATSPFDVVVAADGIGSQLRRQSFSATVQPTGFGVWRADLARPNGLVDKTMMMGPGIRFGVIPTSPDQVYFFATTREDSGTRHPVGQLHRLVRDRFASMDGLAAKMLAMVTDPRQVIFTRAQEVFQEPPWHRGRMVLIGDAAHASTPFLSQGGAMAIEDAVVLAEVLTDPTEASLAQRFEQFQSRRVERCRLVQHASRRAGEIGAINDPDGHAAMLDELPEIAQARIDEVYDVLAKPL